MILRTLARIGAVALLGCAVASAAIAQEEPAPEATLFRRTLIQDIETAGFYELVSWLEVLGASTRGDRAALVDRLYEFYDVTETERAAASDAAREDPDDPPVVVDSASRTRYFTLEEVDERYVRLSGGVILTLRDDEHEAVHRISADEIVINQDRNTLAASGEVVYTLDRGETTEQFTGQALTVELDTWEGAFVDGVTRRERTIEGEEIDFRFAGTYITRSRDEVIVLDDGRITSSEAEPPNYEIRARKIWVLAPGEWGLTNAFLHVGRVPVFYLPFFFKPGDELFFNPALGTRDRSGAYIQTTTYLAGSPEEDDAPFSLLQIADEEGTRADREIEGLYLVPVERPPGDARGAAPAVDDGATVRLLADVYTKLGAYAGLHASVPGSEILRRLELTAGLAASRNIYPTDYSQAGAAYTPYYIADGRATQSWNEGRFGPVSLPFRFGIDLSADASVNRLTTSLTLQAYSDRRFRTDFADRSEQIDWLGLVGQGSNTDPPGPVSSFLWQIDARYSAATGDMLRVSQLSLQRAVVALNWRSKTIDEELVPPEVAAADESPESAFFYPESLKLPEIRATVSGTLLEYPARERPSAAAEETDDERPQLAPPWDQRARNADAEDDTDERPAAPLLVPDLQPTLPSPTTPEPFRASLGYSLSPTVIVDQQFLSAAWDEPSDLDDLRIAYGGASTRVSGSVSYSARLAADLARLDGSLSTSTQYRTLFNRDPDYPDPELTEPEREAAWDALEQRAWAFSTFSAANNLTFRVRPLLNTRLWSGSSIAYSANVLLYQNVFDEAIGGEPRWRSDSFEWDEEYFRQHQVQATAQLDLADTQSLRIGATIPPRDERYTGRLSLQVSPVSLALATGVSRDEEATKVEEEWTYDPLTATAIVSPWEAVSVSNKLSYDLEESCVASNRANLTAGPLTAAFFSARTAGYEFGGRGVGWVVAGEERFRPQSASLGVSLATDLDPLWRNRIVLDVGSELSVQSNLQRFTESSLGLEFSADLLVHRFMRLSLRTRSSNSQGYVYIGELAERVGRERRSFLLDLARSFNVFDRDDRVASAFNLQSIQLNAVHELGDWDLTVGYTGAPALETVAYWIERGFTLPEEVDPHNPQELDAIRASDPNDPRLSRQWYQWRGRFDVTLQWRPIRELRTSVQAEEGEITFGDGS
ncbi:MAG: hypothetical protein ACOCW3_04715 [Spirochaetota bacterium]